MITLSVKNPWSYLIAAGVKDVENRSWSTSYRGRMLIHSSAGNLDWPGTEWLPTELYELASELIEADTPREALPPQLRGYAELCDWCERRLPGFDQSVWRDPDRFDRDLAAACQRHGMPLRAQAIIGEVDLVDVVQDLSISLWAEPNSYHWIVANPRLYEQPILGVKGHLRLWHYKGPLPSYNIS
jgi:hypothetical protein